MQSTIAVKEQPTCTSVWQMTTSNQDYLSIPGRLRDTRMLGGRYAKNLSVPKKMSPVDSFSNGGHSPRLNMLKS